MNLCAHDKKVIIVKCCQINPSISKSVKCAEISTWRNEGLKHVNRRMWLMKTLWQDVSNQRHILIWKKMSLESFIYSCGGILYRLAAVVGVTQRSAVRWLRYLTAVAPPPVPSHRTMKQESDFTYGVRMWENDWQDDGGGFSAQQISSCKMCGQYHLSLYT